MTIDNPWNIDPTSPISNSSFNSVNCAEGMAPSLVNNVIRQLASFFAQTTSYKSADLSSSVSTNIAATGTGLYMDITGANAISSFGSPAGAEQPNAAVFRFLQFDSSASLSHGSNIRLVGGTSRRTQPGDVSGFIHEGSGVWREIFASQASISLSIVNASTLNASSISVFNVNAATILATSMSVTNIALTSIQSTSISASVGSFGIIKYGTTQLSDVYVQIKTASTAASASTSTNIPYDTTIPQNSEGANIFSVSITPRNASSIIEVEALVYVSSATAGMDLVAALYLDNAASAIAATTFEEVSQNPVAMPLYFEHTASTTSEHVYSLRYGADSGAARLNHGTGGNLGGVLRSWMRVKERLP